MLYDVAARTPDIDVNALDDQDCVEDHLAISDVKPGRIWFEGGIGPITRPPPGQRRRAARMVGIDHRRADRKHMATARSRLRLPLTTAASRRHLRQPRQTHALRDPPGRVPAAHGRSATTPLAPRQPRRRPQSPDTAARHPWRQTPNVGFRANRGPLAFSALPCEVILPARGRARRDQTFLGACLTGSPRCTGLRPPGRPLASVYRISAWGWTTDRRRCCEVARYWG